MLYMALSSSSLMEMVLWVPMLVSYMYKLSSSLMENPNSVPMLMVSSSLLVEKVMSQQLYMLVHVGSLVGELVRLYAPYIFELRVGLYVGLVEAADLHSLLESRR